MTSRYNGLSFSWRCVQLWDQGHSSKAIAEIMERERVKLPGKVCPITEARVYNALSKARSEIYERGLKMPLVKGGEVKQAKE